MENTGVGQILVFGEQLLHEMFSTSDSKQKLDLKNAWRICDSRELWDLFLLPDEDY